ncbi:hypothetical protein TRVL_03695 [Trypanosoma vivax]|nr:hypothetical protein TRVL_03695 [Trypanosoma vivax]
MELLSSQKFRELLDIERHHHISVVYFFHLCTPAKRRMRYVIHDTPLGTTLVDTISILFPSYIHVFECTYRYMKVAPLLCDSVRKGRKLHEAANTSQPEVLFCVLCPL